MSSDSPAGQLCTHYACRCDRALELALQAERTGQPALLREALAVHDQAVQCRLGSALPHVDAPAAARRVVE